MYLYNMNLFIIMVDRHLNYHFVSIKTNCIPYTRKVKYLGLPLDRRLTWSPQLKNKCKQLNSCLHILRPSLKLHMNISNYLLLYKSLLQPIRSYRIALWSANTRTIQAFQAIYLRMTANAPWYATNVLLHNDLKISIIRQTTATY